MTKFSKPELIKNYKDLDINQLIYKHYKVNNKIYQRLKLGEKHNTKSMRKLKYKKNILRKLLLKQLIKWFKKKENLGSEISFAEIQQIEKDKKFKDELEWDL